MKDVIKSCIAPCAFAVMTIGSAFAAGGNPAKDLPRIAECMPVARMESRHSAPGRGPGPFGDYWWANRFLSRLELGKVNKGKTVDLVMVGDSITHFFEWRHPKLWEKFTSGRTVINCGYGGDFTQHALWRIAHGELDGYVAKNVVVMIGTNNNSSPSTKPENVATAIEAIVEQIKIKQPKAKIILHPIFPRGDSPTCVDFFGNSHAKARERNDQTNAILKKYADAHPEIVWLDVNPKFLDETGWVPKTIMGDAIHPTAKGYEIWMDALKPVLK